MIPGKVESCCHAGAVVSCERAAVQDEMGAMMIACASQSKLSLRAGEFRREAGSLARSRGDEAGCGAIFAQRQVSPWSSEKATVAIKAQVRREQAWFSRGTEPEKGKDRDFAAAEMKRWSEQIEVSTRVNGSKVRMEFTDPWCGWAQGKSRVLYAE